MQKNNNYDNQYSLITDNNVNVGSNSDLKDFLILIGWIVLIVVIFLMSFQYIANYYIDRMSPELQLKIEKLLATKEKSDIPSKYQNDIRTLYRIEKQIIKNDPKIQYRKNFPIYISNKKNINAWVYADGTIFFTEGILDENLTEQELAFVLAHEIGHYSHRDHLKSISKQLAIMTLCMISGNKNELSSVINGISGIDVIRHTKRQEKNADIYAGEMLIKMYGSNQGGISVMKKIKEKEKYPEFIQYISDHPLTKDRIYILEKQQKNLK